MHMMQRPVLILNSSFEPLHVSSAKKAMKLLWKNVARIEIAHNVDVRPGWPLPSVVRLLDYRHVPHRITLCTRESILARDNYTCGYCGVKPGDRYGSGVLRVSDLTMDHIVPISKGGKWKYSNLITACKVCNSSKADKSLEDSGMVLRYMPRDDVTIHTSKSMLRRHGGSDPLWKKYLYYESDSKFEHTA
jgi:5-methylcytosine-specific restriction endonuclease McrA